MLMYSNKEILDGILGNDRDVINTVYKEHYSIILGWIKKNSGTADDSSDIFHEALLIVIRKLQAEGLDLKCCFSTYLFSICKHLWFQELRKRSRVQLMDIQTFPEIIEPETNEELEEKKLFIYLNQLNLLESKCKKLLLLCCKRKSLREILKIMDFKNEQAVADKKKNCRKTLIKKLLSCKEYKELQSEIYINN